MADVIEVWARPPGSPHRVYKGTCHVSGWQYALKYRRHLQQRGWSGVVLRHTQSAVTEKPSDPQEAAPCDSSG